MALKAKKRSRNDLIPEYLRRETPGGESLHHPPPHWVLPTSRKGVGNVT